MRKLTYYLSLILIFIIPIEGLLRIPKIGTIAKAAGIVVGVVWLASLIVTRRVRRPSAFQFLLVLFVIWNALSILWSANPHATYNHVITWIQLLGLSLMFWDIYASRPAIQSGLQAYVLGAYVAVGSAVQNYLTGQPFYTNYERYASGRTNPDGFGFMLALGLPVAWYLASSLSSKYGRGAWRFVNYFFIPAAFIGLALSGTRTALLASIVGMIFGLVMLTRVRLYMRILVFAVLTAAVVLILPYVQSLKSFQRFSTTTTELTQGDLNNRTNNWQEGITTFEQHPVLGVGGNMYRTVNTWDKVAHNSYLSVLVELGVIGLTIFLILIFQVIFAALAQERLRDRVFWLTLMLVWGMGAFTLTWEYRKTTWLFFTFIVASAALNKVKEMRRVREPAAPALVEPEALAGD